MSAMPVSDGLFATSAYIAILWPVTPLCRVSAARRGCVVHPKENSREPSRGSVGGLEGDSRASTSPATTRSIFPNQSDTETAPAQDGFGLNDFQPVAPG